MGDETLKVILKYRKQEYDELKSLDLHNEITELVDETLEKQEEYLKIKQIKNALSNTNTFELPETVICLDEKNFDDKKKIEKCIIRLLLLIGFTLQKQTNKSGKTSNNEN